MSSLFSKTISLGAQLTISEAEFTQLRDYIYKQCGIYVADNRKYLLENRLANRLKQLNLKNFNEYYYFLQYDPGKNSEINKLFEVITTNETSFYRNPPQLSVFQARILAEVVEALRKQGTKKLRIWSAGCSTGEEPYTLGMVMNDFAANHPGFHFAIMASDISLDVLRHASRAVYTMDKVEPVPLPMKKKYLLRSRDPRKALVRIAPELREKVRFRRLNFMEPFDFRHQLDIIFCRNVVIYFDRPTQEKLFKRFCEKITPGGYLFIGHSESLTGIELPLKQIAPTVYKRI